jgi:hypothetical protein
METVRVLESVGRYNAVLSATGRSLATVFAAYALWVLPLLASRRTCDTFAPAATAPMTATPAPTTAAGLPRDERRRFYEAAARILRSPATGGGGPDAKTVALTIAVAVAGALLLALSVMRVFNQAGTLRPG